MRNFRKEILFDVPTKQDIIEITPEVAEALEASGIKEGILLCNAMHVTSSVFVSNNEYGVNEDYTEWLNKLAPHSPVDLYNHNSTGAENADAFLKSKIMGREVTIAVSDGKLDLGKSEHVFYGEFDGQRRKRVLIKIIGE